MLEEVTMYNVQIHFQNIHILENNELQEKTFLENSDLKQKQNIKTCKLANLTVRELLVLKVP